MPFESHLTTEQICEAAGLTPARNLYETFGSGDYAAAVSFVALAHQPRVALEWGVAALKAVKYTPAKESGGRVLAAVEDWLDKPSEEGRRKAREDADAIGLESPEGVLAMAVFFSGGSITPKGTPDVEPPPFACQKLVAGAVKLAVVGEAPDQAASRFRSVLVLKAPDLPAI